MPVLLLSALLRRWRSVTLTVQVSVILGLAGILGKGFLDAEYLATLGLLGPGSEARQVAGSSRRLLPG